MPEQRVENYHGSYLLRKRDIFQINFKQMFEMATYTVCRLYISISAPIYLYVLYIL